MKRITLFIASLSPGGAERQMSILANLLVEKGYDVVLTTFGNNEDHYHISPKIKRVRLATGKSTFNKVLAIYKYFLTVKTDCVISFSQRPSFLCLVPLLFRRKIKVIASERNTTIGVSDKKEKVLFNYLYRRVAYVVPNSYTQARYICNVKPSLAKKVYPIINYIDIDTFHLVERPKGDVIKIAVFARYEIQKNCIGFADALSMLSEEEKGKIIIDWYGNHVFKNSTLSEYFKKLQEKIKDNKLEEVWHIHDPVKNVPEILSQYDAVCLPSLFEGFSNSVAEGIAAGKPMLVSDVSDNSLMVHQGENGILFNPNNTEDMTFAIKHFLSLDRDVFHHMGVRSRKIAEELFDKNHFIGEYIKLIET